MPIFEKLPRSWISVVHWRAAVVPTYEPLSAVAGVEWVYDYTAKPAFLSFKEGI